jgi:hypothetical protein
MRVFHSGERRLPACSRQRLATTCSLPRAARGVADGVDVSELEMSLSSTDHVITAHAIASSVNVAPAGPGETFKLAASD